MAPAPLASMAHNHLLSALPEADQERLAPMLEPIELQRDDVISRAEEAVEAIHFPLSAVISIVSETPEGDGVEVGTVGRDGLVGVAAFLATDALPFRTVCQIGGQLLRADAEELLRQFPPGSSLHAMGLRYAHALFVQAGITATCNRLHPLEQRAARWVLLTADRLGERNFDLTHQFLATMIGAQRPSVTLAMQMLQTAGLVGYHRGRIEILDLGGLRQAACSCYEAINDDYRRTIGREAVLERNGPETDKAAT